MRQVDQLELEREAGQLRYELARLRNRRSVRAALAVGELRRAGRTAALAALRGRSPRLDAPGPACTPLRPPFPHLRVLTTGGGPLLDSTSVHGTMQPNTFETLVRRDRPDVLIVEQVVGWDRGSFGELARVARQTGTPLVTVGPAAAVALPGADLRVATGNAVAGAHLDLGYLVDVRRWSPAGLDDTTPAHRVEDVAGLAPAAAHAQPVIAVDGTTGFHPSRLLELASAGAVPVVAGVPVGAGVLASLTTVDADLVGDRATLDERVRSLLADDERRRRLSVRLRRHVQRRHDTRQALVRLVERLGIDTAPSERVTVLLATKRPERLGTVLEQLRAQSWRDHDVQVIVHGDGDLDPRLPGIHSLHRVPAHRPLGAALNVGLDAATGAYIAKIDDDDRYGPDHLLDLVLALRHSGADAVGKLVHAVYQEQLGITTHPAAGGEERFSDHLPGATLLLPADVLRSLRWRHVPRAVDTELIRAIHLAGGSSYSTHRYGFVRVRHGDHTYLPETEWSGREVAGFDPDTLVP